MPGPPLTFRTATTADAEAMSRAVVEGLEGYRSFAPPGWSPPPLATEVEHERHLVGDERVWCLLAETDGRLVGQVTILPVALAPHPVDDPALGHLRNLFVGREMWGTGLARDLHAAALEAARERGLTELRLFSAAGQVRARRFYEREGWVLTRGDFHDPVPDLVIVEYRLALGV